MDMSALLNLPYLNTLVIKEDTANSHKDIIQQLEDKGVTVSCIDR